MHREKHNESAKNLVKNIVLTFPSEEQDRCLKRESKFSLN